jgi:DNA-binding transcriptional ArsR family regulator
VRINFSRVSEGWRRPHPSIDVGRVVPPVLLYAPPMSDAGGPLDPVLREELVELTGSMCRALNDPKRLLILYVLGDRELSVGELCEVLEVSQSNVSQHLAVLRERGLVNADRQGSNVYYSLRHPEVLEAVNILRQVQANEVERRQGLVVS